MCEDRRISKSHSFLDWIPVGCNANGDVHVSSVHAGPSQIQEAGEQHKPSRDQCFDAQKASSTWYSIIKDVSTSSALSSLSTAQSAHAASLEYPRIFASRRMALRSVHQDAFPFPALRDSLPSPSPNNIERTGLFAIRDATSYAKQRCRHATLRGSGQFHRLGASGPR